MARNRHSRTSDYPRGDIHDSFRPKLRINQKWKGRIGPQKTDADFVQRRVQAEKICDGLLTGQEEQYQEWRDQEGGILCTGIARAFFP